ncbi:MAG TPA: AraC family transcriptional regulator [Polyangia bacterium]|nr:AraC family transcriptional regulator [Polyangia bacterium]
MKTTRRTAADPELARWRLLSLDLLKSDLVAGRAPGPSAPAEWAPLLKQLVQTSRSPSAGPHWWTASQAFFGNVETRTDPRRYHWDGMKRIGRREPHYAFFQFTLAGWGCFELYGGTPQRIPPGRGFFAVVPSRHRYYLPEASPGWTFGWVGMYHPYLVDRIAKQVAVTGSVVTTAPDSPLVAMAARLVRGAFQKDFRDRFDVERALFDLVVAFERQAQRLSDPEGDRERLLEALRGRVMADPSRPLDVARVAAEHGMSRSHFSHYLKARTGLSPARFMTEVRVQEASRLLLQTRMPLKQIAASCGLKSVSHFSRVFRRFQHLTPAAYRESLG